MPSTQDIKAFCIRLKNLSDEESVVEDFEGMLEILNIGNNIENEDDDEIFIDIYVDIKDTMDVFEPDSQDVLEDFYSYYTNEEKFNQLKIRTLQQIHKNWEKIYEKIKNHIVFGNLNLSKREMKIMIENFGIVLCNDLGIIDSDLQLLFDDEECIGSGDDTMSRLVEFV
jgi:hypothetical protein